MDEQASVSSLSVRLAWSSWSCRTGRHLPITRKMAALMTRHGLAALVGLGVLAGCGGNHGTSSPAAPSPTIEPPLAQTLVFTQSPIDVAAIEFVVPLGNLNPPGHTLPTDHVYFYHRLRTIPRRRSTTSWRPLAASSARRGAETTTWCACR